MEFDVRSPDQNAPNWVEAKNTVPQALYFVFVPDNIPLEGWDLVLLVEKIVEIGGYSCMVRFNPVSKIDHGALIYPAIAAAQRIVAKVKPDTQER